MHEPQRTAARQSSSFATVSSDSGGDCGTGSNSGIDGSYSEQDNFLAVSADSE